MIVRLATERDATPWAALRAALWPEAGAVELRAELDAFFLGEVPQTLMAAVFLAENDGGTLVGMLELSLRSFADGCESSPVPFVRVGMWRRNRAAGASGRP
jgi:aminoglycoside 6'-N-acetyltransferase I